MSTSQEFGVHIRTAFADVVDLIPKGVRLALYIGAVALAASALAAQRVVAIWWPELRPQVDATVAEILPWVLFVLGVLGTAYTPGKPAVVPVALEPGPLELARAQESTAATIATLSNHGWTKEEAITAVQQQQLMPGGESPGFVTKSTPPS